MSKMKQYAPGLIGISALCWVALGATQAQATPYGSGTYGACQYQSCGISLSSDSSVTINVTPSAGMTTCTVARDEVTVSTSSSTGYTMTLRDSDSSNQLTKSGGSVAAVSATAASPTPLTANSWGYRVDGIAGFGAGPTTTQTNVPVPTNTFAAVPTSANPADVIATSSTASPSGSVKQVWYGICVNSGTASGIYSDDVVYTAVVN